MIHFFVGKPRNGKSLRVMFKIIEVLTTTHKTIVTNMVLRLDELQHYLDENGFNVHVLDRVTILDDEQTRNFWIYRGSDFVLPVPAGYGSKEKDPENISYIPIFEDPKFRVNSKILNPDGSPSDFKGCCYVIDEVQNLWPARGWQGTGHHISFYLSQHGKLGDTVIFITQNIKNVDRMLYSVAQDFTYCRNHRIEKHGKFRGSDKFTAKTYQGPVTTGDEATLNVEEFKLNLAVARCYDTSAGVGMPGGGTADAGFRAKGLPLKTVWIALAVIIVICFVCFNWVLPHFTNKYLLAAIDPNAKTTPINRDAKNNNNSSAERVSINPFKSYPAASEDLKTERPFLVALSVELKNGRPFVNAALSNGVIIPPLAVSAFALTDYPEGWVEAGGMRFYFQNSRSVEENKAMIKDQLKTNKANDFASFQK